MSAVTWPSTSFRSNYQPESLGVNQKNQKHVWYLQVSDSVWRQNMFVLYFKRPTDSRQQSFTVCVMSPPVSCSGDGVPSALRPVDRAQPPMLGQHQRSGVGLHQRCGSGHGGQLPGERPAWSHFTENVRFLCRRVQTTSPTLLFVRLITPSLSTTWEPGWRSQQGCCLCACSVFSPTGWLWPPSTTGWPTSGWLWHLEPWSLSSSVSFTD